MCQYLKLIRFFSWVKHFIKRHMSHNYFFQSLDSGRLKNRLTFGADLSHDQCSLDHWNGKLLKAGCRQTANSRSQFKMFVSGHSKKRSTFLSFENFTLQQDLAMSLIKTKNASERIVSSRPAIRCYTNRFH